MKMTIEINGYDSKCLKPHALRPILERVFNTFSVAATEFIRWVALVLPFVLPLLLASALLWGIMAGALQPVNAQGGDAQAAESTVTLSVTQHLILEHINNTTAVVDEVLKVGNLRAGGLGRETFAQHNNEETFAQHNNEETFAQHNNEETFAQHNNEETFAQHNNEETFTQHNNEETFTQHNNEETFTQHNNEETFVKHNNEETFAQHNSEISDTLYYRGYLQFDTSLLPPQAVITRAHLVLNVQQFEYGYPGRPATGTPLSCGVYPVLDAWSPAASWAWSENPGITTSTVYTSPIVLEQTEVYTVDVTGLVQEWVNGAPNHGVMVGMAPGPNEIAPFTAVIYGPASISETLRPRLDVVYGEVAITRNLYLPLVLRPPDTRADLTVTTLHVNPDAPSDNHVVIANEGLSTAQDFWVDLYLDPSRPPEEGQAWTELCHPYGLAWQVSSLASGESLTLTLDSSSYGEAYSAWPVETYPAGDHEVWAYVDSLGQVSEANEGNNRAGPVSFTTPASVDNAVPAPRGPRGRGTQKWIPPRP